MGPISYSLNAIYSMERRAVNLWAERLKKDGRVGTQNPGS